MINVNKTLNQLSGFLKLISTPLPNINGISGTTIFINGEDLVFDFEISPGSIFLQTGPLWATPGHLFRHSIDAFLRGQSEETSRVLDFLKNYKHLVVLQDQDGNYHRFGDMVHGLSFSYDLAPSPDASGDNGYKLSFSGETLSRHLPIIYPLTVSTGT